MIFFNISGQSYQYNIFTTVSNTQHLKQITNNIIQKQCLYPLPPTHTHCKWCGILFKLPGHPCVNPQQFEIPLDISCSDHDCISHLRSLLSDSLLKGQGNSGRSKIKCIKLVSRTDCSKAKVIVGSQRSHVLNLCPGQPALRPRS